MKSRILIAAEAALGFGAGQMPASQPTQTQQEQRSSVAVSNGQTTRKQFPTNKKATVSAVAQKIRTP